MDGMLRSFADKLQEKFEDVTTSRKSPVIDTEGANRSVVQYIALAEVSWSRLVRNAASNADVLHVSAASKAQMRFAIRTLTAPSIHRSTSRQGSSACTSSATHAGRVGVLASAT